MNKKYIVMAALVLCSAHAAFGQLLKGKQEISAGYGYGTYEQIRNGFGKFPYKSMTSEGEHGDYLQSGIADRLFGELPRAVRYNDIQRSGAVFVNYTFSPVSWVSVGMGSGFEQERAGLNTRDTLNGVEIRIGSYHRRAFTVAPELRLSYGRTPLVNIYALFGLGRTWIVETVESDNSNAKHVQHESYTTFQITPFGIRVGRKLAGFGEVGYGYKGVMRFGASYRF